jgi:hypothetical protein
MAPAETIVSSFTTGTETSLRVLPAQHRALFIHGGRELVLFARVQHDAETVPIGRRGRKDRYIELGQLHVCLEFFPDSLNWFERRYGRRVSTALAAST